MPHALTSDDSTFEAAPDWSAVRLVTVTSLDAVDPVPPLLPLLPLLPLSALSLPLLVPRSALLSMLSPDVQPAASSSAVIALLRTLIWNAMVNPPAEIRDRAFLQTLRHSLAARSVACRRCGRRWPSSGESTALAALRVVGADSFGISRGRVSPPCADWSGSVRTGTLGPPPTP